jgi:hypothetical protein
MTVFRAVRLVLGSCFTIGMALLPLVAYLFDLYPETTKVTGREVFIFYVLLFVLLCVSLIFSNREE